MTRSFGPFVLLVRLAILVAYFGVKLPFKHGTRLRVVRTVRREGYGEGWGAGRGGVVAVRSPVVAPDEAQRSVGITGLSQALMWAGGPLPAVVVALGVVEWPCWRVLVSRHYVLDAWIVWIFDVPSAVVTVQLVVAGFEGRVIGRGEAHRVAMLVPLYNEDPDVAVRMLFVLLHQSSPPAEIHVADDGSIQRAYMAERGWFIRQAALTGIYASWQRTPNEGKRHAQVHGFRKIRDADLFVTVDSDSMLDAEAFHEIAQFFSDPRVMPVTGVVLAINNRENLLVRVTDVIFIGQQLIDCSLMSQLGSVMVNFGGLVAYRCSILAESIDTYLSESYPGRYVEFSDSPMLTFLALLYGRTVQQPSAFTFAWMPDRWSHHYCQQERWFRGSFTRGLWRARLLPVLSWDWWRQVTGWMQIWPVISVFVYLLLWRPLVLNGGVPSTVALVPLAIGLAQGSRYIFAWYSDTTGSQRCASPLLSPVATLWSALILRSLRVWGMVISVKMGWSMRQRVEVTSQ